MAKKSLKIVQSLPGHQLALSLVKQNQHNTIDLQCSIARLLQSAAPLSNLLQVMQEIFQINLAQR